jgi:hypothetical protein
LLGVLWNIRQGLEQLQPLGEVSYGFNIGRALNGSLTCLLPVGNRLLSETRFGIVMSEEFGL